jgi:hypothetical protein
LHCHCLRKIFHCPIGKCIAIDCRIDPGLSDARSVVSVLPEKLPGGITLWQSADHHKSAYQAVGNQPSGNQPKNILAISHSSNPLGHPNVVGNQPRKDSSDLNDPPFSTHLIIQRGVNQWSAISRERI